MSEKLIQGAIILAVAVAGAYAVVHEADGWEDYVVMGVILMTCFGFALAVAPKIYARRTRTISRSSEGGPS
jgi:protein-S-isoprenylcysteine O-methyltransferase Ste14